MMHNSFYASGFLFHPSSQQILLQQTTDSDGTLLWSLFGRNARPPRSGKEHFQDLFFETISLQLDLNDIHEVYTYESPVFKNTQTIYYAEIEDLSLVPTMESISWFTFKQLQKLPLVPQSKHDLMIGKRVIESSLRKKMGLHTIE